LIFLPSLCCHQQLAEAGYLTFTTLFPARAT
jgi:hypothetical protein